MSYFDSDREDPWGSAFGSNAPAYSYGAQPAAPQPTIAAPQPNYAASPATQASGSKFWILNFKDYFEPCLKHFKAHQSWQRPFTLLKLLQIKLTCRCRRLQQKAKIRTMPLGNVFCAASVLSFLDLSLLLWSWLFYIQKDGRLRRSNYILSFW